jgi:TldD protein
MRDLTSRCLDLAEVLRASYADVRVVRTDRETILVKNGQVEHAASAESYGFGVRVIVDGAWGFCSSDRLGPAEVDSVTAEAVRIARASALVKQNDVHLSPARCIVATYATPVQQNPFSIPLEKKVALLRSADQAMRQVNGIRLSEATMQIHRQEKTFASTEGSHIQQEITQSGAGIRAVAVKHGEVQRRSYPSGFGRGQGAAGYEFIESLDLVGNAPRIAEEAVKLLSAKPCPSRVTSLILDGSQLCLQLHESAGHGVELDRVLGSEASFAGTSFLTPDKLGGFRYGSDIINITADATRHGGVGTYGYDDEGVPASQVPIVRDGIFTGYLTSRESAHTIGQTSNGAMRAENWNRIPLVRMTNVSLEPGGWSLEDLIADTKEGVYMATSKSLSIDDKRLNFHFGTEIAWEIKGGKLGQVLKNPAYTGITPRFWCSCDAICSEEYWRMWAVPQCEKGQPSQAMPTGHGAAPARFRNVQVGGKR